VAEAIAKPGKVVLSRDLSDFLVEFSIALHRHAMYPTGHPSLGPAAERLTERAARLLEDRPTIAFGVARHQLIIDGVATDPNQPVLRRLAEALHRCHLGAMSILPGAGADEISGALHALAAELGPESAPLGLAPADRLPTWAHLRLHPLTFERLELVEDEVAPAEGSDGRMSGHAAQLWIGLATAAIASAPDLSKETVPAEPAQIAKAIDEHHGAVAYDQVIVGYLLQIADELKSASGVDLGALRRRTARLIAALRPETLERLVAMGGDLAQRRAFVLGATSGMAVESVVKILKAAAEASHQTISHGLIRMLSKLAAHAEGGPAHVRPLADGALREQVERLLSGWDLDDPVPETYGKVLGHLAATTAPDSRSEDDSRSSKDVDPLRIIQMSLEVESSGPMVDRAIDSAIDRGDIRSVVLLLSSLPAPCGPVADMLRARVSAPGTLATLLAREPLDLESLDAVLPWISVDGYAVMIDALATSQNRTTRRRLLDRLAQATLDVVPVIVARLDDERWYVQRNLLMLLERLGRVPPGFSPARWTRHADARVRYQAIALALIIPHEREAALRAGLEDDDRRVTRLGLLAFEQGSPRSLTPLVAQIATNSRIVEELRVHAVRALARCRDRVALDTLLDLVDGGKSVLGRPKLPPLTPIVFAAVRALAEAWSANAEACDVLRLAGESSNPELRKAAGAARL
jgi:hypothetical protein